MTSKIFKTALTTTLAGLGLLTGFSSASAAEHEIWRDQVKTTTTEPVILEEDSAVSSAPDHKFWREQVNRNHSHKRYVAAIRVNSGTLPGYVFWREQVKPQAEGVPESATASQ